MAGHSHWNNIQRRKGAVDKKRAKIWGKVAKKIMIAAKRGGDPKENLALRYIIDEAKSVNMPKDTIQKAVDKGSGAFGTDNFETVVYEGYAPGGVALIIETLTDNRSRTAPDLRHILDRHGGSLATSGAVSYQFKQLGVLVFLNANVDSDALMEAAMNAGAADIREEGEATLVITSFGDYHKAKDALEAAGFKAESAEITFLPDSTVSISPEHAAKLTKMLDMFDDNDDVQNVYHNAEYDAVTA